MKFTAKKKLQLLKIISVILLPVHFFAITSLGVVFNWDSLWSPDGITTFSQWSTTVLYRLLIYIAPAMILMCFKYDKRYKTISRFVIWLNWIFMLYTIANATICFLALDQTPYFAAFNSLDSAIGLSGFVLTTILKRKIELGTSGAIVGEKP